MIVIDVELCKGCGICKKECPNQAITIENKQAVLSDKCTSCGVCTRVCPFNAATRSADMKEGAVRCKSCPVQCEIQEGCLGACQRYSNVDGTLIRNRRLVTDIGKKPLITAVGAGTNYPCCKPAPHIVQDMVDGVETVTVVTEAPLSYSGVKVKIDTNIYIGEEGAKVKRNGKVVGMVDTEEYGSKMLSIGGANLLTGKDGFIVARTIVEIANGERVTLKVDENIVMELQVGHPPVINGIQDTKMRVGCGSATIGMFAVQLKEAVDEAIILDHHVVGLLSEHLAGEAVGLTWSGVIPNARRSTRGRYFGEHGQGWGGTNIDNPIDAIKTVDMTVAKPGIKILVTETTGQKAAVFKLQSDGSVVEIPMDTEVQKAVDYISDNCESARVSALYVGGTGGSARAGVAVNPIRVTQAVHSGDAKLTIGGADTFVLPGGGINFMVDVEKIVPKAFTWVPTPATVAPVEYTLSRQKYEEIGGHVQFIKKLEDLK